MRKNPKVKRCIIDTTGMALATRTSTSIQRSDTDNSGRIWPLCQCGECMLFFRLSTSQRCAVRAKLTRVLYCSNSCQVAGKNRLGLSQNTKKAISKARIERYDKTSKWYRKVDNRHEHRTVAEQMLGRPLKKGEIVHHIDSNKRNNDPSNLQVMTQSQHASIHFKRKP